MLYNVHNVVHCAQCYTLCTMLNIVQNVMYFPLRIFLVLESSGPGLFCAVHNGHLLSKMLYIVHNV